MAVGRVPGPFGVSEYAGVGVHGRRPLGVVEPSAFATLTPAFSEHAVAGSSQGTPTAPPRHATKRIATSSGQGEDRDLAAFTQAVKEAQIRRLRARGRTEFEPVPGSELEIVEGKHRLRRGAAMACRDLLAAARAALEEARAAKHQRALITHSIGIQSAHRDYDEDARAWRGAFATHYEATRSARAARLGGQHGDAAVALLAREMIKYKTPPGWSNHSNGTAVDFNTTYGLISFAARSSQRAGWRETWLHRWLVLNAGRHGFHPLSTEEWHWDFR